MSSFQILKIVFSQNTTCRELFMGLIQYIEVSHETFVHWSSLTKIIIENLTNFLIFFVSTNWKISVMQNILLYVKPFFSKQWYLNIKNDLHGIWVKYNYDECKTSNKYLWFWYKVWFKHSLNGDLKHIKCSLTWISA